MQVNLSPDSAMRVLSWVLVRYRLLAGKNQDEAAERLGRQKSSIAGYETGRNPPTPGNLLSLLDYYGKRHMYDRLLAVRNLAARKRDRTEAAPIGMLDDTELLLGVEFFATTEEVYSPIIVDGLAQTERYGKWLLAQSATSPAANVDEAWQLRLTRQAVLHRKLAEDQHLPPLRLRMFIEESALRRPIGGPEVLAEQLAHLEKLAALRNIEILVIPEKVIYHNAMRCGLKVVTFDNDMRVFHTADHQSSHYYESPGALDNAGRLLAELKNVSLDQTESLGLISTIREELATP